MTELRRMREAERWLAWIRVGAVAFAIFQVAIASDYPKGYERLAWITTGIFAAGALVLLVLSRRDWTRGTQVALGACALAFDFAVVSAYILIYHFQLGSPIRQVIYVPLGQYLAPSAWRKSLSGVLDGPATPIFWNIDKSE